jgi:hypothetical protein
MLVELLHIFEQGVEIVRFGEGDLEHLVAADRSGKSRERGLTGSTHADEHSTTSGSINCAAQSKQVCKGIIENDKSHLLGWVLLIEVVKLCDAMLFDVLVARASFVDEWSLFFKLTILIHNIRSHEISELELSEKLRVFEAKEILELFFGDSIKNIFECLLVLIADQFINEGSLRLVAPQTNKEQLGILNLLDIGAVLDDLILMSLSNTGHTTEDTSQFTDSEDIVELGGGRQELTRC